MVIQILKILHKLYVWLLMSDDVVYNLNMVHYYKRHHVLNAKIDLVETYLQQLRKNTITHSNRLCCVEMKCIERQV